MGTILQVMLLLFAVALIWEASKIYRGVPDKKGQPQSLLMGHGLIVFAVVLVLFSLLGIPYMVGP